MPQGFSVQVRVLPPSNIRRFGKRLAFEEAISSRNLQAGIAIDDGVGVYIINGVVNEIVHARGAVGSAYLVISNGDTVNRQQLARGYKLGMKLSSGGLDEAE